MTETNTGPSEAPEPQPNLPKKTYEQLRDEAMLRVSNALKNYMKRNRMGPADVTETVLQMPRSNTAIYGWLAMRCLPSSRYIPALGRVLKVGPWYFSAQIKDGPRRFRAAPTANGQGNGHPNGSNGTNGAGVHAEPAEASAETPVDGPEGVPGGAADTPVDSAPIAHRTPAATQQDLFDGMLFGGVDFQNVEATGVAITRTVTKTQTISAPTLGSNGTSGNARMFTTNDDGTATVVLRHTAPAAEALHVLNRLTEMGLGAAKKD